MQILQEITDWAYPNGIYHVNDRGGLVAFKPLNGELTTFTKPLSFSMSHRKFTILETIEEIDLNAITVTGSNGKVYTILNGKCSCPGFTYRGKCRHVG